MRRPHVLLNREYIFLLCENYLHDCRRIQKRAVYKRYNLVGNVPDSVFKTSSAIFHVNYGCVYVDLDNICHIVAVFHVGLMQCGSR